MAEQPQDVVTRLRAAEGPDALKSLADEIAAEVLDAPKAVVHLWATGGKDESGKAGSVVIDLEELAVHPMLDEFDAASVQWRYNLMEDAVDTLLRLRNRVLARFDGLLADRSVMSASAVTDTGQPDILPRRVCDEAYVWARRLAKIEASKESGFSDEAVFLKLEHTERNEEIQRWKRARFWKDILEEAAEPPD